MGLNTENAGALIGRAENAVAGVVHKVEVLISTFIHSLGRDVQVGEEVEISNADYRFLKPHNYVKDADVDGGEVETDEVETETTTTDDEDKGDGGKAPNKVEGKRK